MHIGQAGLLIKGQSRLVILSDTIAQFSEQARILSAQSQIPFPSEFPFGFRDGKIVDAGEPALHVAVVVEFPVLVTVGAIPLAGGIVILVFKTHRDAVFAEGPEFLFQAIIQFALAAPPSHSTRTTARS